MQQGHSTILRRPLDFTIWAWWLLATAGPCAVWALSVYLRTRTDLDALLDAIYYEILVGPVIGVLQGLILRRYLLIKQWWMWSLLSWVGWLVALLFLSFGAIFSVGTMMDPVNFEDTPSLQCIWVFACGIAGWAVGAPQSAYFPRYLSSLKSEWTIISASTLMFGGFIGRFASTIAYKVVTGDRYIYHNSPEQSMSESMSIAIGIMVAGIIFGAITCGMLIWSLRRDSTNWLLARRPEGSDAT